MFVGFDFSLEYELQNRLQNFVLTLATQLELKAIFLKVRDGRFIRFSFEFCSRLCLFVLQS